MFVSDKVVGLFQIAKDTVDSLREELAALRAERNLLREQLTKAEILSDFFRAKVNQLELQNTALMEKAYGVKIPAPEIVRATPPLDPSYDPRNFTFHDVGDEVAQRLGYPLYGDKQ